MSRRIATGDEVRLEWPGGQAWVRVSETSIGFVCGLTTTGRWIGAFVGRDGVRITDHRPETDEALRRSWEGSLRPTRVRWSGVDTDSTTGP